MKKKIREEEEKKKNDLSSRQKNLEQEKRREDHQEIVETDVSKKLTAAMLKSSQEREIESTLDRAVDVLRDQNGN